MKSSVFQSNRPYFIRHKVNNAIVSYGVQKAPALFHQALASLGKLPHSETLKFPEELTNERWWMEKLLVWEAEDLHSYAVSAASLAYRFLRKKRTP